MYRINGFCGLYFFYKENVGGNGKPFLKGADNLQKLVKQKLKPVKKIILHHTATRDIGIEKMKKSMKNEHGRIPAHYIIGAKGGFQKIQQNEGMNVFATKNGEVNLHSIQIETIGNFNKRKPTKKQYEMLGQLEEWIEEKYGELETVLHKNVGNTACPGEKFDENMVRKNLLKFSVSRYYSPVQDQEKYYPSENSGYMRDKKINCGVHSNCFNTASNTSLKQYMAGKVAACHQGFDFGTKIYLENYGIVKCIDRGGAVEKNGDVIRIDIRMGGGEKGLNRILNNHYAGRKNGFIPNSKELKEIKK